MDIHTGRRLVILGALWGLLLALVPALVMMQPGRSGGFLVAALLCAVVSGCAGALVAGRRVAARRRRVDAAGGGSALLGLVGTGALLGLVGGAVAAILFWALMTVTLSGLSLDNPVEVSTLMRPQVFLGSFFVALSVFVYVVAAGAVLSPASGALVRWAVGAGGAMTLLRLLGLGAAYGLAFALIKSLFPSPVILLTLVTGPSSEGNLTVLALVYMGVGLLAGLISAPVFGAALLLVGKPNPEKPTGPRLTLSLMLAAMMGVVSGILTLLAYGTGILPTGGVLDPLSLIRSSNFPTGTPLLIAWTIARDLLPAGLAGLFLSPFTGGTLVRLYQGRGAPAQKSYEEDM